MLTLKFYLAYVAACLAVTAAAGLLLIISALASTAHAGAQKRVNPFAVTHESRMAKAIREAHGGGVKVGIFQPQLKALKVQGRKR